MLIPKNWVRSLLGFAGVQATRISPYTNDNAALSAMLKDARVQECHIAMGHLLCELVENDLLQSTPSNL